MIFLLEKDIAFVSCCFRLKSKVRYFFAYAVQEEREENMELLKMYQEFPRELLAAMRAKFPSCCFKGPNLIMAGQPTQSDDVKSKVMMLSQKTCSLRTILK